MIQLFSNNINSLFLKQKDTFKSCYFYFIVTSYLIVSQTKPLKVTCTGCSPRTMSEVVGALLRLGDPGKLPARSLSSHRDYET